MQSYIRPQTQPLRNLPLVSATSFMFSQWYSSAAADLARIEAAVSPGLTAGARYDPAQMAHLDSEAHP
jgi:hypothetical protein